MKIILTFSSMRNFGILLFTFIITLTSMIVDLRGSLEFHSDQLASAPALKSAWESDSLAQTTERYSKKTHHIAQDFIPIVILAEAHDFQHKFTHYLSLYKLYRQKEYFLLI